MAAIGTLRKGITFFYTISNSNSFKVNRQKGHIENIVGERENAGNQHFLLFPQCFLPFIKQSGLFLPYVIIFHVRNFLGWQKNKTLE